MDLFMGSAFGCPLDGSADVGFVSMDGQVHKKMTGADLADDGMDHIRFLRFGANCPMTIRHANRIRAHSGS
jgi:hypothetical protein